MTLYLAAFGASFLYITLKALQQRQVMAAEYMKMPPISFGMAFCEVFIVANVVHNSSSVTGLVVLAFCIGAGGSLGSILGTWLHKRRAI